MNGVDFVTPILTVFGMLLANAGLIIPLFLWIRSDTSNQIIAFRQETSAKIDAIQAEIKDFHGRLCAIEERNRK